MSFQNLLVTTDFSELSLAGPRVAAGIDCDAVTLLHVIEDLTHTTWHAAGNMNAVYDADVKNSLKEHADDQLSQIAVSCFHRPVKKHAAFSTKATAQVIAEFAEEHGHDLIVMASHGRGAIGAAILGSVAQKVVHLAPCPVLIVPPAIREAAKSPASAGLSSSPAGA